MTVTMVLCVVIRVSSEGVGHIYCSGIGYSIHETLLTGHGDDYYQPESREHTYGARTIMFKGIYHSSSMSFDSLIRRLKRSKTSSRLSLSGSRFEQPTS